MNRKTCIDNWKKIVKAKSDKKGLKVKESGDNG